jgi:hypothetical protein
MVYSTLYGKGSVKIFKGYLLEDECELIATGYLYNDDLYFFDKTEDFSSKDHKVQHARVSTRSGGGVDIPNKYIESESNKSNKKIDAYRQQIINDDVMSALFELPGAPELMIEMLEDNTTDTDNPLANALIERTAHLLNTVDNDYDIEDTNDDLTTTNELRTLQEIPSDSEIEISNLSEDEENLPRRYAYLGPKVRTKQKIASEPSLSRKSKQAKLDDLHIRTGISKPQLVDAIRKKAFNGSTLTPEDCEGLNLTNSDAYYMGHYKSKPLKHGEEREERKPCQIFAGDILAKFNVPNDRKEDWIFLFTDVATAMLFPYFGKSKKDFATSLVSLKEDVVDKTNYKWEYLQTDDEKATTKGKVKQFVRTQGIKQRISAPYKHGQNGTIEKMVNLVQDLAATLMFQSGAPRKYYFDAIKMACHILNTCRIPR